MESNGRLVIVSRTDEPADRSRFGLCARLSSRPWYRTTSCEPGLLDIQFTAEAGEPLSPHIGLEYWKDHETLVTGRLGTMGVRWAMLVDCGLGDLSALTAELGHAADSAHMVLSITEDEIFRNVDAARASLAALHDLGAVIRVTGCGTRFFAMAGYRPLAVDQVVINTCLPTDSNSSALKRYWVITDIIRRAGATIFTECQSPPRWLAAAGVDFYTSPQAGWHPVPASETPSPAHQEDNWRKVGLRELSRPRYPSSFGGHSRYDG